MSTLKQKKIFVLFLMVIFSLFLFGCENNTPVENIKFEEREIVLLVGETYTPKVEVSPHYATERGYTITSNNTLVVKVEDNTLVAVSEGTTTIKVTAKDNSLIEDYISVQVRKTRTTLDAPKNLIYDSTTQTFSFDIVDNVSSYTLKINSDIINIGNSATYSLERYNTEYGGAYDEVLEVSVRANAASYSQAFISSSYSSTVSVYQNSAVTGLMVKNGVLTFDKVVSSNNYKILINGEEYYNGEYENSFNLMSVASKFAGKTVNLSVIALANTSTYARLVNYSNITFYDSLPIEKTVSVMNICTPAIVDTTISWNTVLYASQYNILINGEVVGSTTDTHIDLSSLECYEEIVPVADYYTINIDPVMSEVYNVLKTDSKGETKYINRLATPVLSASNNQFSWTGDVNTTQYILKLTGGENDFERRTDLNSLTIVNYPAGNYTLTLRAVGDSAVSGDKSVNLLPSNSVELTITKQAPVAIEDLIVADYTLIFKTTIDDTYSVSIGDVVNEEITATSDNSTLDLSSYEFEVGEHEIIVTHLGDGEKVFDSSVTTYKFIQLEAIDSITIENGVASVALSAINESATIEYTISSGDAKKFTISDTSWTINTIDDTAEDYLSNGNYTIAVSVIGDGATTFSANRTGKVADSTATANFNVLSAPTLSVSNKDTGEIAITSVNCAIGYDVYNADNEFIANIVENTYVTNLQSGSISLNIRSIGDGSTNISSGYSNITLSRLVTPTLTHDNATDIISKVDNNANSVISSYEFKHNDETKTYDFNSQYTDFIIGENTFTLKFIAVSKLDNIYYLNSNVCTLIINKIDDEAVIWVNADNQLVITPVSQSGQYDLSVKFTINSTDVILTSNAGKLTNDDYALDYEYESGSYYVDLVDNRYQPIITNMTRDFSVSVKFVAVGEGDANSSYTSATSIALVQKSTITRAEQYLSITNVAQSRTIADYMLLVNEKVLPFPADTIVDVDNQIFKVSINYILDNVSTQDIYDVRVVTLNIATTETTPTFVATSESLYFTLAQTIVLTSSKNNDITNNSVVISFDIEAKDYAENFVVELYNLVDNVKTNTETITFSEDNAVNGSIIFNLDRVTLTGKIYVSAYVSTVGEYISDTKTIHVFNSNRSNELDFTKIASVDNVYVSNGTLYFDSVENAIGYEIYREVAGTDEDEKINTNLITTTEYALTNLTGESKIKVKAISLIEKGGIKYTNANVSDAISVYKLETPVVTIENGDIVITLSNKAIELLQDANVDCNLIITNGDNTYNITLDMTGVILSGNVLIIEPELVLSYGESITTETLNIQLIVNYTYTESSEPEVVEPVEEGDIEEPSVDDTTNSNSTYYLNSNIVTLSAVKGLLAPKNVGKTTNSLDDTDVVENITWDANAGNIISGASVLKGYVMKIEYFTNTTTDGEGIVYYSTDSKLLYKNGNTYSTYSSVIAENKTLFPSGYDIDGNGIISKEEAFNSGTFRISIKAVPIVKENENLVCSKYSIVYEVKIMATPEISVSNGSLTWEYDTNATCYIITVYDSDYTTQLAKDNVTSGSFDFSNSQFDDFYGLYGVTIQAQSSNKNVINSQVSEMVKLFRMASGSLVTDDKGTPETTDDTTIIVEEIDVEDGSLVLIANAYFESAELEFVDTATGNKQTLIYSRADDATIALGKLNIVSWEALVDTSVLFTTQKHVVNIYDSEILNIIAGRSYTINVKLLGNSNGVLPIISSRKAMSVEDKTLVKLNTNLTEVKAGTFKFSTTYTDDLNYNFNNVTESGNKVYWNDIYVYVVTVAMGDSSRDIYCVDYNSLSNMTEGTDYVLVEDMGSLYAYVKYAYDDNGTTKYLYFNVYENNTISLKDDYIYYYKISKTISNGNISYAHVNGDGSTYSTINLVQGGSFILKVALLGGDILNDTAYLTANAAVSKPFLRYTSNVLTSYDGKVRLNDQREYDENDALIDSPIYKLTIAPINTENYSYVYIYYTTEEDARKIIDDANGIYVLVEYDEFTNVIFDMTKYYPAGSYQVKVQTLAGLGTDGKGADYFLNSKEPTTTYVYKKVSDASASTSNGVLQFALSYITEELGNKTYIYDYEITLTDASGAEYVYTIDRYSEGVTIDSTNNLLIYNIPDIIEIDGEIVEILNGNIYTIKARGISIDSFVLNGTYEKSGTIDKTLSFKLSDGLEADSVRIEDGVLKWKVIDTTNYSNVNITLTYQDSTGSDVNITITTPGVKIDNDGNYYYRFEDAKYRVDGLSTTEYIDSGKDYTITMYVIGTSANDSAILNSNKVIIESVNRVEQVESTDIISIDGVLSWNECSGAIEYIVTVKGNSTYTYTTTETTLDMTTPDDNGNVLVEGDYTITIKAIGDNLITAMTSENSATFTMLSKVSNIKIDTTGYFTWDKVDNAQGYKVVFEFNGSEPVYSTVTENRAEAPEGLSGSYTMTVSAIGIGVGTVFNGESSTYTSTTDRPESVSSISFYSIDETDIGFKWAVTSDFGSSDSLFISYSLRPYVLVDGKVVLRDVTDYDYHTDTYQSTDIRQYTEEGVTYYYFVPTVMGLYTDFSVRVSRIGATTSYPMTSNKDLSLQLFSYGAGTSTEPYRISNVTHLLNIRFYSDEHISNIKFYSDAHYILTNAINLAETNEDGDAIVDITTRLSSLGAIVSKTFNGVLDGAGNRIVGLETLTFTDSYNFALFGSVSGAEIKNLIFGNTDSPTNISNTFANSTSNMINLSLIAINATSTTITNVTVNDFTFTVAGSIGGKIYIGGLVAVAENTTITNAIVNMTLNLSATLTTYAGNNSYVGAVIAKATNCTITSDDITNVNFTINQTSSTSGLTYVGGMFGQLIGSDDRSSGVYSSMVTVSFTGVRATNIGAVVGQMSYATIDNVTVTSQSTISNNAVNYDTNMGGIAGAIINSYVQNVIANVTFTISITKSMTINIGAFVGNIATSNDYDAKVTDYSTDATIVETTILTSTAIDSLGVYGAKSGSNITVKEQSN